MTTHYVSPQGGRIMFEGVERLSRTLKATFANKLRRGDIVQLVSGVYEIDAPITVSVEPRSGGQGIVVRGAAGVLLRGAAIYPPKPGQPVNFELAWGVFVFDKVDGLLVEWLAFEQCWPNAIVLHGCSNAVVAHCTATHGTNFIFARSAQDAPPSHGFKIHDVTWEQDPDQLLWNGNVTWCQVKQGEREDCAPQQLKPDRHIFNGALFHARKILGGVEIFNCTVRNAFNGIRLVGQSREPGVAFKINNVDVHIHRNHFFQVRDNVIEPEKFAYNWWVYRNEIVGSYATFSFDGLQGDYFYYFANRCRIATPHRDTDGTFGDATSHFIGHSFKFYSDTATGKHFYSFHNSIHTCYPYAKEGATAHWVDCNNAIEFVDLRPAVPDPHFFRTERTEFKPGPGCRFRGMLSNYLNFPQSLQAAYPVEGVHQNPVFAAGAHGKFDLPPGSPGRGGAVAERIEFVNGTSYDLPAGEDIGAVQRGALYAGPDFVPYLGQAGV
jgi:hypothetical protein